MNTVKSFVLAIGVAGLLAGCAAKTAPAPSPDPAPPPSPAASPAPAAVHHALETKGMKNLQHALAIKEDPRGGVYYKGKIDGLNGKQTRDAVARYQQDLGVTPTGDVDEQTRSSLGLPEGN